MMMMMICPPTIKSSLSGRSRPLLLRATMNGKRCEYFLSFHIEIAAVNGYRLGRLTPSLFSFKWCGDTFLFFSGEKDPLYSVPESIPKWRFTFFPALALKKKGKNTNLSFLFLGYFSPTTKQQQQQKLIIKKISVWKN
jgi:hypothetical protein